MLKHSLIDERNAVSEIWRPNYRVMFVAGTAHSTYQLTDATLADVQEWVKDHVGERQYAVFVEFPARTVADPDGVRIAWLEGTYSEADDFS